MSISEVWYVFFYFAICLLICSMNFEYLICAGDLLVPIVKEFMFIVEGDRRLKNV